MMKSERTSFQSSQLNSLLRHCMYNYYLLWFKNFLVSFFFVDATRIRPKKQAKPKIPDYADIASYNELENNVANNVQNVTETEIKVSILRDMGFKNNK